MKKLIATLRISRPPARLRHLLLLIVSGPSFVPAAYALEFNLADAVKLNWDTKVGYSTILRLQDPSQSLVNEPAPPGTFTSGLNQDDGDRNFRKGVVSNRFDLFTEADVKVGNFGARLSAAAWYDAAYKGQTDHDSPGTSNNVSVPFNEFTRATRKRAGRDAEVLDAFVFGGFEAGVPVTFRAGRHTLYWGETFFFSNNGIAGAQAPIDAVKALSVPSVLAKEIFRPVGQVSTQIQISPSMALGAYYQYKWERTIIPPAGSFFSVGDILDEGGECFRFAPSAPCGTPGASMLRAPDIKARNSGQYGLQLKFKGLDTDWGLYATNSHAKTPNVYFNVSPLPPGTPLPPGAPPISFDSYRLVFAENIKAFGASFSKTVGELQLAGEVSTRHNQPLASTPALAFSVGAPGFTPFDNDQNPGYAVGNTAHVNLSVLASLPPSFLARQASLTGEIAWNRTLRVTKNPGNVEVNSTRDATGLRLLFTPSYSQVLPGLDIDVPIGLGYTLDGKSSAVAGFGGRGTGDFSIGVKGTYLAVWNFSLNYGRFLGPAGNTIDFAGAASYKQAFKDRENVSLSLSTTF